MRIAAGLALAASLALLAAGCDAIIGEPPPNDEVTPPPETPPADELEAALRARGADVASFMIREGEALRGEGDAGSSRDFTAVMHPGWCYKVVALGEGSIEDLDLRVYDPGNVLLQRDTTQDRQPHVGQMRPICPATSGAYRIELRVVRGRGQYAAQLYRSI
ncbi:MAG: hypothetical protein AB7P00_00410 [Sandaracinaceae bacterium]